MSRTPRGVEPRFRLEATGFMIEVAEITVHEADEPDQVIDPAYASSCCRNARPSCVCSQ